MHYKNNYFNRVILVLIAVLSLNGWAFGQVTPPTGMVGWYAGDGDFRDSSGNGNNATPASGVNMPGFAIDRVGQGFNL